MADLPRTDDVAAMLGASYGAVTELVSVLDDTDFDRPTRCDGLPIGALLVHLLFDAQRALITIATPASPPADRDFVTYWLDFAAPGDGPPLPPLEDPSVRFVRRLAAAYARPSRGLVRHWRDTSEATTRAAAAAPAQGYVSTQGHVLAVPDFIATLVFEAAIHQLDLALELPDAPAPPGRALDLVARTLDGLLGAPARSRTAWDLPTYALKATGRIALNPDETDMLGSLAAGFPVIR